MKRLLTAAPLIASLLAGGVANAKELPNYNDKQWQCRKSDIELHLVMMVAANSAMKARGEAFSRLVDPPYEMLRNADELRCRVVFSTSQHTTVFGVMHFVNRDGEALAEFEAIRVNKE